jgi:hypothetical protein
MDRSVQLYTNITFTWRLSAHFMHLATLNGPRKGRLLCEQGYVIPCVGNLTDEKSCVCLNFQPAYEYRNYV